MLLDLIHRYMIEGILNAGYDYFGGDYCLNYIPLWYHLTFCTIVIIILATMMYRFRREAVEVGPKCLRYQPNLVQKLCFVVGIICLVYTAWRKLMRHEGLFMTNPCHFSLMLFLVLLLGDNSTQFMRWLYTVYSGFNFGAFAALLIPHLQGLNYAEVMAFLGEHILIWPLGPLVLYRRYGCGLPGWRDHFTAHGSVLLYHFLVLIPLGRWTKVSINFMLCPSPEQWFISFGYHYFTLQTFNLLIIGYLIRLFTFGYCYALLGWWWKRSDQTIKKE